MIDPMSVIGGEADIIWSMSALAQMIHSSNE